MSLGHLLRCRQCATFCVRTRHYFCAFSSCWRGPASGWHMIGNQSRDGRPAHQRSLSGQNPTANRPSRMRCCIRPCYIAPDNSLARWQLGEMKVGNEWLSVEEAQRRAEADPRQTKYQERKESLGESPQGQLALARWCRGNKLEDEAQFHWSSVLSIDPNNKEALRAAGMRWHDGELKTVAQIREAKVGVGRSEASNATMGIAHCWLDAGTCRQERPGPTRSV